MSTPSNQDQRAFTLRIKAAALLAVSIAAVLGAGSHAAPGLTGAPAGQPGAPYKDMPVLAPIGVRTDAYLPVPASAQGPAIDPVKGYRLQQLGRGLYMVTDNAYQSMFLVYESGVVVADAPPIYSKRLRQAIAEVTRLPVTHVVYSHSHVDHIAGVRDLGGDPVIIAHQETKRLLERARDPRRPLPTVTFADRYTLEVGSQRLELSYHGVGHEPGNIFIYAPEQKALMVVDVVFPGWMPWRRFALAKDVAGFYEQVEQISRHPFETLVAGHVARTGTHEDVRMQLDFMNELKSAAATSLETTRLGAEMSERDKANFWALSDNYIDRVAVQCVNRLAPRWQSRLAAFDVYIWDQCYAMEQSLRID